MLFHTNKKNYKSRSTISQIIEALPVTKFIQVHRAFVVNKDKIEKYNSKSVVVNGIEIPLSKKDIFLTKADHFSQ